VPSFAQVREGILVTFLIAVTKYLREQFKGRDYFGSWFQKVQSMVALAGHNGGGSM
jgi:hypothetical protein